MPVSRRISWVWTHDLRADQKRAFFKIEEPDESILKVIKKKSWLGLHAMEREISVLSKTISRLSESLRSSEFYFF